jgi:putative transposase
VNWSLALRKDQTMKRKRHTEEQIIAILKEHEAGIKTADLCRKHGISEASFYNWKAKYGGLEVSEAKRLKGLESENAKLKKLLADAMLDNAALKDLLAKKGDARCQARGCRSCTFRVRVERAAGVQDYRLCADDGAVLFAAAARCRVAGATEGSRP